MSATARRHGLSASQLFAWRKAYREGRLGEPEALGFAPALMVTEDRRPATDCRSGRMEIVLGSGRRIVAGADVDAAALARVVAALEAL